MITAILIAGQSWSNAAVEDTSRRRMTSGDDTRTRMVGSADDRRPFGASPADDRRTIAGT